MLILFISELIAELPRYNFLKLYENYRLVNQSQHETCLQTSMHI